MSEEYDAASTVFVKVDGDQTREVLKANGVNAFPTFKVYKDKQAVFTSGGFKKAEIAKAMEEHGAVKAGSKTE